MTVSFLWPFFLISFFFMFFANTFLPFCSLIAFAPFMVLLITRLSFHKSLWMIAFCGLIVDLTSGEFPFGIYTLNYTLVALCLHRFRLFFTAKPLGLSFLTFFFSLLATLFQKGLWRLFGRLLPLNWESILSDFVFMPLMDAFYAFLWFSCSSILYTYLRKKGF